MNFINTVSSKDINYNIAKYLLNNITYISNMTIYDVAEACYVSPASVSRFSKLLGYSSFSSLKEDCLEYTQMKETVVHVPDFKDGMTAYIDCVYHSLKEMEQSICLADIDKLVSLIDKHHHICLLGIQFSQSIAMQMQTFLVSSGKMVEAPLNFEKQMERIENYGKDDLIILFSARGNYGDAYFNQLTTIRKNKPKLVLITQAASSRLSELADLTIQIGDIKDIDYSNYNMYMMMSYISYRYLEYVKNR